jgi:hypothetical protein
MEAGGAAHAPVSGGRRARILIAPAGMDCGAKNASVAQQGGHMKRTILLATGFVFLLSASPGFAKSIKKHEAKEENHIEKGVKKGKITPKEQERLENQQQNIERERQEAWEDGKMSGRERKDIHHDQKRLDQDIKNKKTNARDMK